MFISVKADFDSAINGLRLSREEVLKGCAVAINRTANTGRALMARRIRARRKLVGGVLVSDVKSDIAIQRATPLRLVARLMMFGGRHIPLSQYMHSFSKATGFQVNVVGEGLKTVRDYGNKGFSNDALRGGAGSIRTQGARTPTKMLRGPTLASAVTAHGWQSSVLAPQLRARFVTLLTQQLRYRLSRVR